MKLVLIGWFGVPRTQVRRLVGLDCREDPAWCLQLLRAAAPHLRRLHVQWAGREHLAVIVEGMPKLRRLGVDADTALESDPPVFSSAALGGSLEWLRTYIVPRATVESLLRAHAASLREVHLYVGTECVDCTGGEEWPWNCRDLTSLVRGYQMPALRRLVPRRLFCRHSEKACRRQLQDVRSALPGVEVACQDCDEIPWEEV